MALNVGALLATLRLDDSQYRAGLRGAEQAARSSLSAQERAMGESGARQASALGSRLRTGMVAGATAAGAAGAAALGTALKLGLDRLTAIDDARGKLRGLGHDAVSQAKIMDSAMASVKGTAFGLGDAASISASAVAAGIKPGQDLTKYLKSTADAATIAGSSLGEMGSIFNQVQTGQQAMTDDLNQLADRGIPIYQWLGKEMKVSAGEVKGLASEGKVSSEIFFRAIQKNIGGAALESGKTVTGSFNNVKAALARLGAAALEPSFGRLPATFRSVTSSIDGATPRIKAFASSLDAKMFDQWIPAAKRAFNNPEIASGLAQASRLGASFLGVVRDLAPAAGQIAASLGQASAALGISSWRLFLTGLEAVVGVLNIIEPILSGIAGLMTDNQAAVTAAVGAWLLFKTIPSILGSVRAGIATVGSTTATATGAMQRFGAGIGTAQAGARNLGTAMSTARGQVSNFAQSYRDSVRWIGQANQTTSTAGRILFGTGQQAQTASTHLRAMGSVAASAASGGFNALKAGASGVMGALGGPFGAALAAAGIAFAVISAKNQKATQSMEAYQAATKRVADAQVTLNDALMTARGSAADDNVKSAGVERMQAYRQQLEAESKRTGSFLDDMRAEGQSLFSFDSMIGGSDRTQAQAIEATATGARDAMAALDGLKLTQQSLADVTYGSQGAFDAMVGKLNASGDAGKRVATDMQAARTEFEQQRAVAQKVTPGISELSKAMQVLGDKTASAADKSSALKAALDALNPARTAGDAIAAHDKVLQQVAQSTQEAADRTKGFGTELIGVSGAINTTKANGNELRDALKGIVDASVEAASKGQPIAEVNAKNADAFKQLATQYGLTAEQVQRAYDTLGGKDVNMVVRLAGAPEAVQKMAEVARAFEATPNAKTITVKTNDIAGVQDQVRKLGFTVNDLKDGTTTITANTDEAKRRLADIQRVITADIPSDKAVGVSTPGGQAVYDLLKSMGVEVTTNNDKNIAVGAPLAPSVLEALKQLGIQVVTNNDKTISIKQVGAEAAKAAQSDLVKPETKTITVRQAIESGANIGSTLPNGQVLRGPGVANNADGSIRQYANGGISGLPQQALIQRASAGGGLVQWAEPETEGEAFIPLASSKRARSTQIWLEAGRRLGVMKFAEGGLRTASAINDFPRSGSLEGSPYKWGGVNWGDCSGAMSAIANFAVGLAPFASRFATASEGAELTKRGFKTGKGPAGTLRFGWVNGGPGGGHTAGTLPDGTNVEMGGGRGNGQVGGKAAGADDAQFTDHAYLRLGDSGQTTGSPSAAGGSPSGSGDDAGDKPAAVASGDGQRVYVTGGRLDSIGGSPSASSAPGVKFSLFANGGIEDHTAHITDKLRVFGEPETGGEAYIPLAPSKRARSLAIWQQTGRRLGVNAYAGGGIAVPKIEAPKIEAPKLDMKAPAFMPGGPIPIDGPAGTPQLADTQSPAATFDGAKYTQERLTKLGVDMLGIAKDAAIQTLVPGGSLPSILTNSIGLAKSIGSGLESSAQNQRGNTSESTTSENGGNTTVNNVTINATNTEDAMRQWQTKQNRDAAAFEGKIP